MDNHNSGRHKNLTVPDIIEAQQEPDNTDDNSQNCGSLLIANVAQNLPINIPVKHVSVILCLARGMTRPEAALQCGYGKSSVDHIALEHKTTINDLKQVRDMLTSYVCDNAAFALAQKGFIAATNLKIDPKSVTPHHVSSLAAAAKTFHELANSARPIVTGLPVPNERKSVRYKELRHDADKAADSIKQLL